MIYKNRFGSHEITGSYIVETAPWSLPEGVVCVLHCVESASCSSLNVRDLIVKHLQPGKNKIFTSVCSKCVWCLNSVQKIYVYICI